MQRPFIKQTACTVGTKNHLQLSADNEFAADGCNGTPSWTGPLATVEWLLWHRSPTLDAMSTNDTRTRVTLTPQTDTNLTAENRVTQTNVFLFHASLITSCCHLIYIVLF